METERPYSAEERQNIAEQLRRFAEEPEVEHFIDYNGVMIRITVPLSTPTIQALHEAAYEIQHGTAYRPTENPDKQTN